MSSKKGKWKKGKPLFQRLLRARHSSAVISHVSNDCFAVPAMGYLIWAAMRAARRGSAGDFLRLSVALAAALSKQPKIALAMAGVIPVSLGLTVWQLITQNASGFMR